MIWSHLLPKKSLLGGGGGGGGGEWQTKFNVKPRSRSSSWDLGPSGPDLGPALGPDLDLTWDLDLSLTMSRNKC